jgi:hypothetical protein
MQLMAQKGMIEVAKEDVLAAWAILENLPTSLDQIGSVFGRANDTLHNPRQQRALQEALAMYLTPRLVQAINDARIRLGQYVPDDEAEALSERIAYWDYAAQPKDTGNPA